MIYVHISEPVRVIQSKKNVCQIGCFSVLITRQIGANTSVSPGASPVYYWMIV